MGASLTATALMLVALAISAIDVTLVAVVLGLAVLGLPRSRVISFAWIMPVTVTVVGVIASLILSRWGQSSNWWPAGGQAPPWSLDVGSSAPTWVLLLQALIGLALILGGVLTWLKAPQAHSLLRKALSSRAAEVIGPFLQRGTDTLKRIPGAGIVAGALLAFTSLLDAPFFAALLVTARPDASWSALLPLWLLYGFISTAAVLVASLWVGRLAPSGPRLPMREDGAEAGSDRSFPPAAGGPSQWGTSTANQPLDGAGSGRRGEGLLHVAAPLLRVTGAVGALIGVVLIAQAALSWLL